MWTSACGMLLRCTSLFCGRVGEEALVWLHHKLLDEFPAEFAALVDKGFTHCVGAYLHLLHAYYPAFVHDGEIGVQGAICELLSNDKPPSPTPKRQSLAVSVCVNETTGAPMPPSSESTGAPYWYSRQAMRIVFKIASFALFSTSPLLLHIKIRYGHQRRTCDTSSLRSPKTTPCLYYCCPYQNGTRVPPATTPVICRWI